MLTFNFNFRKGSTFAGELFNQNPDALYLFEPLGFLQDWFKYFLCFSISKIKIKLILNNQKKREQSSLGCDINGKEKMIHLFNHFNCNAPAMVLSSVKAKIPNEINAVLGGRGGCTMHNVCMRSVNNWACDKTLCQTETEKQGIGHDS
jgi:hypothetical protein